MTDARKIPTLALLGLSFTGCAPDGIAGTWRAVEGLGMKLPQVEVDGDVTTTTEGTLIIGEDLKGELRVREHEEHPGFTEHTGYDVEIEVKAQDDFFVIEALDFYGGYYGEGSDDVPFLLCDLDGDVLSCENLLDSDEKFKFARAD